MERILGCTDLRYEQSFSIPLETNSNKLSFVFGRNPVVIHRLWFLDGETGASAGFDQRRIE